MGFVKRVCKICGHRTNSYSQCGREECDKNANNDALPIREAIHDHCAEEDQHGLCTAVGCWAETVPLGLVNPPIDGSAYPTPEVGDKIEVRLGDRVGQGTVTAADDTGAMIDVEFPTPADWPDLGALAEACRAFLEYHDDPFENEVSPYGPLVIRLRDLLHPQVESRD